MCVIQAIHASTAEMHLNIFALEQNTMQKMKKKISLKFTCEIHVERFEFYIFHLEINNTIFLLILISFSL